MTRAAWLFCLLPAAAFGWNPLDRCGNDETAWPAGVVETEWAFSSTHTSNELGLVELDASFAAAYDEWGEPGCSGFGHRQLADEAGDPLDDDNPTNLIGWYESGWPAEFGSATLAITIPVWRTDNCNIVGADMIFNGVNAEWVRGMPDPAVEADVQSVAVHEVGHWIGFDHNTYPGSSLTALYSLGLDERDLTCDDTEGVCALYPTAGFACTEDVYCPCDRVCIDGACGVDSGDDDDTEPGDDDDSTPSGDDDDAVECGSGTLELDEGEPNSPIGDGVFTAIDLSGGDAVVTGSITCGVDSDLNYSEDWDDFYVDPPCATRPRIHLDWAEYSDLDFYLWDERGDRFSHNRTSSSPPEEGEPRPEGVYNLSVVCFSGEETDYRLFIDYPPYSDDWPEFEREVIGNFGAEGCCSGTGGGGGFALLLLLLPWLRRRG